MKERNSAWMNFLSLSLLLCCMVALTQGFQQPPPPPPPQVPVESVSSSLGSSHSYPAVPLIELSAVKLDDYLKEKTTLVIYAYHKFHEKVDKLETMIRDLAKMLDKHAVVCRLNVGRYENVAEELKISKAPTVVVINSEGKRTVFSEENELQYDPIVSAVFEGRPSSVFGIEEEKGLQAFLNLRISYPKVVFLFSENPVEARPLSIIFRNKYLIAKIPYDIDALSVNVFNATRIPSVIILTPSGLPPVSHVNSIPLAFDNKYNMHYYAANKWSVFDVYEYLDWVVKVLAGSEPPAPPVTTKQS
eukprot:TRINITY_DN5244_c0_g1_i1.p1 TRINITY_DN5244_c0_g1~~TRINITY_DN5244_c0_g1_i1.p1  ORF type:complete len:303 (+),score=92.62 TRINITY_DN5244_c0_g1_i1:78-986(+)